VETWHKTFKRHHLGSRRNLRADDLVHLLQGVVDVDFQNTLFQIKEGILAPTLSSYDMKRKKKAQELDFATASRMVKLLPQALKVFTTALHLKTNHNYQGFRLFAISKPFSLLFSRSIFKHTS
jgi:hypothetical protein